MSLAEAAITSRSPTTVHRHFHSDALGDDRSTSVEDPEFSRIHSLSDNMADESEKSITLSPLDGIREEIAENVSIAGLKEALTERIPSIRWTFCIAVLICVGCTFFYSYGVLSEWRDGGYVEEIQDVVVQSLPMSNITVCADVGVNETFIEEDVQVPKDLEAKIFRETGMRKREFVDQFIKWISIASATTNTVSRFLYKYFRMVETVNPEMSYYTYFIRKAHTKCSDILRQCKFNGQPFDCCSSSQPILTDAGLCYQIAVSVSFLNFPRHA